MLLLFLRGLLLGLVAGLPLGPASATVVDTALRRSLARAVAVGFGGAFVDFVYCQAVSAGLGALLRDRPALSDTLLAVGGVVLAVFGAVTMRTPPPDPAEVRVPRRVQPGTLVEAAATGVFVSAINPALLVSWTLLAGTVLGALAPSQALVAASGVFSGTFLWFVLIAWLAHKGRVRLGPGAVWITRVAGLLLLAYGLVLVCKVGVEWAARM